MKPLRVLASSVSLLTTLVLLGILFIMVNYIASRRYARVDLTSTRIATLSQTTIQLLSHLTTPVTAIVFYQPQTQDGQPNPLYPLITDLLKEYERYTNKLTIERVDPYQDPARAEQLVKELAIDRPNLVIFRSGTRHKYLSDTDLAEYNYSTMTNQGEPRVKAFKGEAAFTSAILGITQADSPLVWFISGHGEKSIEQSDSYGLSNLKKNLEQQTMQVKEVTLLERSAIPPDVKLVVIAGPTRRLTETELGVLQAYLEHGGRLLALIDPLTDTGLDGVLTRWGVELGMDIVVDPKQQLPFGSAANLFVTTYTQHPIVQKMKTLMTLFPLARSVRPAQSLPKDLTVTPLALTSDAGWGETKTSVETFQFNAGEDLKGPVSIAVAAERTPSTPPDGQRPARTRLVAIGDSEFVINAQLGNIGNRDFLLGAVYWLMEQEQRIGIGPKPLESLQLNLTGRQLKRVFWFSFLTMPLVCGVLGVGVWWLRRT